MDGSEGTGMVGDDPAAESTLSGRYEDLVESLTELARTLTENESVRDTLGSILALALRSIPTCHAAGVTVPAAKDQPSTIAATDEKTYELDRRQYVLNDGPCLDAARRQQVNRWSLREAEQRWPEFTSLAEEMGLRSYLSAGRDLAAQLEHALRSRAVIDQAIGIVMAESRCDADQAFATLSRASNNRNMKLRDLATEIVMRVGGQPPSQPHQGA